ncbi:MAG: EamA family transporter [Clostridia bacterium]|nr:EamA family transporter [Clostridia bacterium]
MKALLITLPIFTSMLEGIFIKRYNSRHEKGGSLFIAFVSVFAMLFFILTDQNGLVFPNKIIVYGSIAGILYCVASYMTYVALAIGSFAMSMLIISYDLVLTVGYGLIFLKEPASAVTYTGLFIAFVSLFLVNAPDKSKKIKFSLKWLASIVCATVASGLFTVLTKMQQADFNNAYTNEFMIICMGLSATVLTFGSIIKAPRESLYFLRHGLGWAVSAGASNGATNFLSLALLNVMPISIATPTKAAVKIIASFIWAYLIYKERYSKKQLLGVGLGVVAIVLLNI